MNEPCHTYEWAMSHIWMSHVTHMNDSCHKYEWAYHTYEWVVSRGSAVCHVAVYSGRAHGLCHYELAQFGTWKGALWLSTRVCCNWVTLHVINRCTDRKTLCTHGKTTDNKTVCTHKKTTDRKTLCTHRKTTPSTDRKTWSTHINESYDVYGWVMSHTSHITIKWYMESCSIWLWVLVFGQWVMLHISIRHMIESLSYVWDWMSHMCDSHVAHINQAYEWVTWHIWLIQSHTYESDSFICLIDMCNMTYCHTYDSSSVTHINESCQTYECVMSYTWTRECCESCHIEPMSHVVVKPMSHVIVKPMSHDIVNLRMNGCSICLSPCRC